LRAARPHLPFELNDRAADGWEPLLAIADLAGSEWPRQARRVAVALAHGPATERPSRGLELLAAIRRVHEALGGDRISTHELIRELALDEESPFAEWWDERSARPASGSARRLAGRLRPYEIYSQDLRIGGKSVKGYLWQDFQDAWRRHLSESATSATSSPSEDDELGEGGDVADVTRRKHGGTMDSSRGTSDALQRFLAGGGS
jgi:hypothetical protein